MPARVGLYILVDTRAVNLEKTATLKVQRWGNSLAVRIDMIWIHCNPQAGREMRDVHPLLVLSPKAFNERTGIVNGLPMTTAAFNETNPFAVKFVTPRRKASYILGHQPKSYNWRVRQAKPHPWRQIPEDVFTRACETLNQIIAIGN